MLSSAGGLDNGRRWGASLLDHRIGSPASLLDHRIGSPASLLDHRIGPM